MSVQALPTLRLGTTGEDVGYLQFILNKIGYGPLATDCTFGSNTEKAVKRFQQNFNLVADGIVGSKTWLALQSQIDSEC